jgi:hypothetical protein
MMVSGLPHCINLYAVTSVLEKYAAPIVRVGVCRMSIQFGYAGSVQGRWLLRPTGDGANGAHSEPTEIMCKKMACCRAIIFFFITGDNSDKRTKLLYFIKGGKKKRLPFSESLQK